MVPDERSPRRRRIGRGAAGAAVVLMLLAALGLAMRRARVARRPVLRTATALRLGTTIRLSVVASDEERAEDCIAAALARLEELEAELSAQRADSALNAVNRAAGAEPAAVPDDLFRVIQAGVRWYGRTNGCFDIAVGPLLALWKRCGKEGRLPAEREVTAARALTGADHIELDPEARTVRLPAEGMRLHLGGIGKGFCADEIAALLRRRGVRAALVAMAGDIYALGRRPDGRPWRIGVQDPRAPDDPSSYITTLELSDRAVSTSGNYRRYVEIAGRRHSHIIDPRTGRPADAIPSVTVIGPDATTTDVLGTALSVMGLDEALRFAEDLPGVEALFVTLDRTGRLALHRTSGFHRYEVRPASPRRR